MSEHRSQFPLVEDPKNALGAAHGCVARVPPGGERVGIVGRAHVQRGHRLMRRCRQFPHDPVHRRLFELTHRHRVHRLQSHLRAVEVRVAVDADGQHDRPDQNHRVTEQRTDEDDQRRHPDQQAECLRTVGVTVHRDGCLLVPGVPTRFNDGTPTCSSRPPSGRLPHAFDGVVHQSAQGVVGRSLRQQCELGVGAVGVLAEGLLGRDHAG